MEDSSKTIITSILDYLMIALRYIASGFVALGVYAYLYSIEMSDIDGSGSILIFAAATIGIITYALHFATLDKVLYGWCVKSFIKDNKGYMPQIIYTQIDEWEKAKGKGDFDFKEILAEYYNSISDDEGEKKVASEKVAVKTPVEEGKAGTKDNKYSGNKIKRKIMFALANQTYLRSLSNNKMLAEMQKQVEKRLSLLNFLYCSLYQIVIITLYFGITHFDLNAERHWPYIWKFILLIAIAILFFFSAYRFNLRICGREMWLVHNFSQSVEAVKGGEKEVEKAKQQEQTPN